MKGYKVLNNIHDYIRIKSGIKSGIFLLMTYYTFRRFSFCHTFSYLIIHSEHPGAKKSSHFCPTNLFTEDCTKNEQNQPEQIIRGSSLET